MPNDAKLGMLAGVLGVLIAAVVLSQPPGQPANTPIDEKDAAPAGAAAAHLPPAPGSVEPPSSPVARAKDKGSQAEPAAGSAVRNDVDGQPTSRQGGADEGP
jgi:hypothetical protein